MKIINKKHLKIDLLISKDLVTYEEAISFMEKQVSYIAKGTRNEVVWFLEHPSVYTTEEHFSLKQKI